MIDIGKRRMCGEAREWMEKQPNLYHAWRTCPHALWLAFWINCVERWTLVQDGPGDRSAIAWREYGTPRAIRRVVSYREALALWKSQEDST